MNFYITIYPSNCHPDKIPHISSSPEGSFKPLPSQYCQHKVTTILLLLQISLPILKRHINAVIQFILSWLASFSQGSEAHHVTPRQRASPSVITVRNPTTGVSAQRPFYCHLVGSSFRLLSAELQSSHYYIQVSCEYSCNQHSQK